MVLSCCSFRSPRGPGQSPSDHRVSHRLVNASRGPWRVRLDCGEECTEGGDMVSCAGGVDPSFSVALIPRGQVAAPVDRRHRLSEGFPRLRYEVWGTAPRGSRNLCAAPPRIGMPCTPATSTRLRHCTRLWPTCSRTWHFGRLGTPRAPTHPDVSQLKSLIPRGRVSPKCATGRDRVWSSRLERQKRSSSQSPA